VEDTAKEKEPPQQVKDKDKKEAEQGSREEKEEKGELKQMIPMPTLAKRKKKKLKKQMDYDRHVESLKAANAAENDFSVSQAEVSSRQDPSHNQPPNSDTIAYASKILLKGP
jgi:ATP-binding cassette subfamily F protein 1